MGRQFALPLSPVSGNPPRIVVGNANEDVVEAFAHADRWPFHTAILAGPPRAGKSLLARWFVEGGFGDALDNADSLEDADVFHRWNRAQETGRALLIVSNAGLPAAAGEEGWHVALPDLASRLGAALPLVIEEPDDAMTADLIALHAEVRGLMIDDSATAYLVARCERSHLGVEQLVAAIDRLSLERKQAPTMAIWRDALAEMGRQ